MGVCAEETRELEKDECGWTKGRQEAAVGSLQLLPPYLTAGQILDGDHSILFLFVWFLYSGLLHEKWSFAASLNNIYIFFFSNCTNTITFILKRPESAVKSQLVRFHPGLTHSHPLHETSGGGSWRWHTHTHTHRCANTLWDKQTRKAISQASG